MWRSLFLIPMVAWAQAPPQPPGGGGQIRVIRVDSAYRAAATGLSGSLRTGQEADILLSGVDFNRTGGGLLFNHPRGLVSDGNRLLMSDGNNNRILIWSSLPDGNTPPDLVLGQPDMDSNATGRDRSGLNWPGQVSVSGAGTVVAADTYNDRLLIWRSFPEANGQAADIEIRTQALRWPWGVWTDGERVVASSTGDRSILFWNRFPERDNQPPDFVIRTEGIGTPRTITSDGNRLIVGDHNAFQTRVGNFFWKRSPTSSGDGYDYFASDPMDGNAGWMQGAFLDDGRLALLGRTLHIWPGFPESAGERPAISINAYSFRSGDGGAVVHAGGRLYLLEYNNNRIAVYNQIPSRADQRPDFAIGSPDLETNTLLSEFFITNAVPVSNGGNLFVSSDFDRRLSVWKNLPDESGARPDWVYELPFAPWDNTLFKDNLILAGGRDIAIWNSLPLNGEMPARRISNRIGSVEFRDLRGVALDDRYFYLADNIAEKLYVWRGIPGPSDEPVHTIDIRRVARLSANGEYLVAVATEQQQALVWRVSELGTGAQPAVLGGPGMFNLPQGAGLSGKMLMIADTNNNRVHIWRDIETAIARRPPDVMLGSARDPGRPEIGRSALFWPATPSFDGSYLWLGEFKFSNRLLRFRVE